MQPQDGPEQPQPGPSNVQPQYGPGQPHPGPVYYQPQYGPGQPQPGPVYYQPWPPLTAVQQQPPDFVLWSLFNILFLDTLGLGFIALILSIKSRDRKVVHDLAGASFFGERAGVLNFWAFIIGVAMLIAEAILVAIVSKEVIQKVNAVEQTIKELNSQHQLN